MSSPMPTPPCCLSERRSDTDFPGLGPEPVLISRKQVDTLYIILEAVQKALAKLEHIHWIVTGGSLLGAVRQHSILFSDDDIDIAILEVSGTDYVCVKNNLQRLLGTDFIYSTKAWQGSDRVRLKACSNIFLDLFWIRQYSNVADILKVIGVKENGDPQPVEYTNDIMKTMKNSLGDSNENLFPCWHFGLRKAIELWPREVYRPSELWPLCNTYTMGPISGVYGPHKPVRLLRRAFGSDCFEVYFQSQSHQSNASKNDPSSIAAIKRSNGDALKPLVQAGGTWEGGRKINLQPEHFIPIQPVARAKRRQNRHCREALLHYLTQQVVREEEAVPRTIYMDGVFDLFHIGHLKAIEQCKALGDRVILGVTGDDDAASYKRPPVVCQEHRVAIVESLVEKVVCPCPLYVTRSFMEEHGIDLVVHGYANDRDALKQRPFFETPMQMGKFQRIVYSQDLSTTDILSKIDSATKTTTTKWFGRDLEAATNGASAIPYDPFPLELRCAIEPHIRKAALTRKEAIEQTAATVGLSYEEQLVAVAPFILNAEFAFDTNTYPIRQSILKVCGFSLTFDLTQLHKHKGAKMRLLQALTENHGDFQHEFDKFVKEVCVPKMVSEAQAAGAEKIDTVYYQAFPCIRIVQPDEFSIGPHADIAYGHPVASVNMYVPLTCIGGTASLYKESRPGAEDWRPIQGRYGFVCQFGGSSCLHWTPHNKTDYTRVSLDVRLVSGSAWQTATPNSYRDNPGYYSCCRQASDGTWHRHGAILTPDARVGFPWTVKDWSKLA